MSAWICETVKRTKIHEDDTASAWTGNGYVIREPWSLGNFYSVDYNHNLTLYLYLASICHSLELKGACST